MTTIAVSSWLSIIGLMLDIVGVMLLFFFGLGPRFRRGGTSLLAEPQTDEQKALEFRYDRLGRSGLLILVAGFLLQAGASGLTLVSDDSGRIDCLNVAREVVFSSQDGRKLSPPERRFADDISESRFWSIQRRVLPDDPSVIEVLALCRQVVTGHGIR